MSDKREKDLNLVDGVMHDYAMDKAERGKMSDKDHKAVDEIESAARSMIKEARQRVLEQARQERLAENGKPSISARILAMTKDAILARLHELQAQFPGKLAVQHRKLEETSLDDLRTLLADIEAQIDADSDAR